MTKLRVLSGDHAGASIDWLGARLMVGRSEERDVFIGDWDVQELELRREADGRHQARWLADGASATVAGETQDGDSLFCWLEDFVPVRFGGVILCVGPSDTEWPSDAFLLERCFAPPTVVEAPASESRRSHPRRSLLLIAAATPIVAMTAAATLHFVPSRAGAHPEPATERSTAMRSAAPVDASVDPVQRLLSALDSRMLPMLDVQRSGDRLVVRGVLASRADVDLLNNRLDAYAGGPAIKRRFLATPEIIDRLVEALPGREVHVTRESGHRFRVSGTVDDPVRANQAIGQVASDLAEFGLEIDSDLQSRHTGIPALSGLLVDNDGTSVLRTSDGVKHIVVGRVPDAAAKIAPDAPKPLKSAQTELENHHAY